MAVSMTLILLSVPLLAVPVALKWQGNGPHALAALLCALSAAQPICWVVTHAEHLLAGLPPLILRRSHRHVGWSLMWSIFLQTCRQ